jgi:ATP phosphoribosyltransferase regulatory subunit
MNEEFRWLLPAGVDELLPDAALHLESIRRDLVDECGRWGYDLVMPPMLEFLDSLMTGTGEDLEIQTFKMADHETGHQLGVRADITPQVARIDAHRLRRDGPSRLCYYGSALLTHADHPGGSREPLLLGAELFGSRAPDADVEVITLMARCLELAGIRDMHVDLGHVGVSRSLVTAAGLDAASRTRLFDALQRKSVPDVESLVAGSGVSAAMADLLVGLTTMNGPLDGFERCRQRLAAGGSAVVEALENLAVIADRLAGRLPVASLGFDLAELRGYGFHTGAVFSAFVSGHGREIARGGRYDDVGAAFGRARAATGFSMDLRRLLALSTRPVPPSPAALLAPAPNGDPALERMVAECRARGERVVRWLPDASVAAGRHGCDRELVRSGDGWEIRPLAY